MFRVIRRLYMANVEKGELCRSRYPPPFLSPPPDYQPFMPIIRGALIHKPPFLAPFDTRLIHGGPKQNF